MPRYYLDTNICVYGLHRAMPSVLERIKTTDRADIVLSTLVAAELAGGVMRSARPEANRQLLEIFFDSVTLRAWGMDAVWHYGRQGSRLRREGKTIGTIDLLLGCQALADPDGILVTHNVREFQRIEGLRIEDWAAA